MIDIAFTLQSQWAGSEWTLSGDDYEGLTWLSDTPKPTLADLEAAYPLAQAEAASKVEAANAARDAAVAHARTLGFTDEMIAVMYPSLGVDL
jgi:hypothetical protein